MMAFLEEIRPSYCPIGARELNFRGEALAVFMQEEYVYQED